MENKSVQEWKTIIYPALRAKRNEFKLVGYEITTEEIWRCLNEGPWRANPSKRLHEMVQDIFQLSITMYMDFIAVHALQSTEDDLRASIQALTREREA